MSEFLTDEKTGSRNLDVAYRVVRTAWLTGRPCAWFNVTHNPDGWPERHDPVNGHMGYADSPLCPNPPVWKVDRTGPRGKLWGHPSYFCDADLPAEFRRQSDPQQERVTDTDTKPKTYTKDDLSYSQDGVIECAECGVSIMPDEPMIYFVGIKEGFHFYHAGRCAEVARKDVYDD